MARFLGLRLASLLVVVVALSVAVFAIRALLPADPVRAMVGAAAPIATVERVRHELGYDQPIPVQYVRFVSNAVGGDLGTSLRTRRSVTTDIVAFAPATIELALVTALLALLLGGLFGVWAALGGRGSGLARLVMTAGASTPSFAIAIGMLLLFYATLRWLPPAGRLSDGLNATGPTGLMLVDAVLQLDARKFVDAGAHLVIPAVSLALVPGIAIGRVLRSSLSTVMAQDYVTTARVKGLSEPRVILRHGLRNAIGPALSMAGLQTAILLSGVVIIESVMAWPGLGRYTSQAIEFADFPAITAVVLILGVAYVVINTLVDILQVVADPRLRARWR